MREAFIAICKKCGLETAARKVVEHVKDGRTIDRGYQFDALMEDVRSLAEHFKEPHCDV